MASFAKRLTRETTAQIQLLGAAILLLGAAAAPHPGLAQSAFEPVANTERERQIVDKIHEMQSRQGPYAPDLIEPWMALSLVYEEEGLREFTTAAIEEARQAVRVNYGLYSLEEAPLLQRTLRIKDAAGDVEAAMGVEDALLDLAKHHPDDLRIVPILREIGDRRLDVLERYLNDEMPAEISLGCYYQRSRRSLSDPSLPSAGMQSTCLGGSRRVAIRSLSAEAWTYYHEAVGVMTRNGRYASSELQEMESQLLRISYSFSGYHPGYQSYYAGKQSYRRLISYNAVNSAPWLARIETFVEMTDWDLLFSQKAGKRALSDTFDAYRQSHDLLEQKGVPQASIDEIFAPELPVVLPTFLRNPLASEDSGSGRYIDAAFDITMYGRSEHVDVLDTSMNATSSEQNDLVRLIRRSVFRPRTNAGRFDEASRIVVRYHLPDASLGDRVSQR
jgi:hypothetical protein